jgi:hypothetical protein
MPFRFRHIHGWQWAIIVSVAVEVALVIAWLCCA